MPNPLEHMLHNCTFEICKVHPQIWDEDYGDLRSPTGRRGCFAIPRRASGSSFPNSGSGRL